MTENPVWRVYDLLRTTRLNLKYYAAFRIRYAKLRLSIEMLLVFFAASSLIAGTSFSDSFWGHTVWIAFSLSTVLLAVINPLMRFSDKEKSAEAAFNKYLLLTHELEQLSAQIRSRERFDKKEQNSFIEIIEKSNKIASESAVLPYNKSLIEELQDGINKEMPADSFYVPSPKEGSEHD